MCYTACYPACSTSCGAPCASPVSCVLKVTGPGAYENLVVEAAMVHNCTNKWLPTQRHCVGSSSAPMRRLHVCEHDGGDGAWLCNAFTHWTRRRTGQARPSA